MNDTTQQLETNQYTTGEPQPRLLPRCHIGGFANLDEEFNYWIEPSEIQGKLPEGIRGTLYRNGPGRNTIGEEQYGHFFDGDGLISAVSFANGRVHYKNRYVRTPKYIAETRDQAIRYRGIGTQIKGGMLKNAFRFPGNAANTGVVLHANKLLALWEGGRPWELDPATLETVGEYNYEGMLTNSTPFSAHGTMDPRNGYFYNFGVFGVPKPKLHVYKINEQGIMIDKRSHNVGDYSMAHDFAITENYAVFAFVPSFFRTPLKFVLGLKSIAQCLEFDDSVPAKIVVVSLKDLSIVREYTTPAFFGFHFGNAFEEGDEVKVDMMYTTHMMNMDDLADVFADPSDEVLSADGTLLYRFNLNLSSGKMDCGPVPGGVPGEFPVWNEDYTGVKNRYTYVGCFVDNGTPYNFNGYQKLDADTGEMKLHDFGPGRFTSEAVFIPAQNPQAEDDGHLCVIVYNYHTKKSEVVLIDARDMQEEVAVIPLRHHVPFGFHGKFYTDVFE